MYDRTCSSLKKRVVGLVLLFLCASSLSGQVVAARVATRLRADKDIMTTYKDNSITIYVRDRGDRELPPLPDKYLFVGKGAHSWIKDKYAVHVVGLNNNAQVGHAVMILWLDRMPPEWKEVYIDVTEPDTFFSSCDGSTIIISPSDGVGEHQYYDIDRERTWIKFTPSGLK